MPLILVTGNSGSGKSAVCAELQRRGYEAHDTDQDGNAVWVNRRTGEAVTMMAEAPTVKSPEWFEEQAWCVVPERVEVLAVRASDRLIFLCGSTANEQDVWPLFARVVYLTIDAETLRHRLASRTTNDFGKDPSELQAILRWHEVGAGQYRAFGAAVVDATRPLHEVVDEIVAASMERPSDPR